MATNRQTFKDLISMDEFIARNGYEKSSIGVSRAPGGVNMLTAGGQPIATLSHNITGNNTKTPEQIIQSLQGVNLTVGIQWEDAPEYNGRPALPNVMKNEWETASLF